MIRGLTDTWFTVEEFASMVGRAPKTILNWASEGRIQFANLCGVNLVSMRLVEALVAKTLLPHSERLALRLMGRITPNGLPSPPERRRRRAAKTGTAPDLGPHDASQPEIRPCDR